MAGAIAHEIGNPLSGLRLIYDNLIQTPDLSSDPRLAEDMKNIGLSIERIEALVREAREVMSVSSIAYAGDLRSIDLGSKTKK